MPLLVPLQKIGIKLAGKFGICVYCVVYKGNHTYMYIVYYRIAIYISTGENIACIIGIYRDFHFMGEIARAKKLSKKSRFSP